MTPSRRSGADTGISRYVIDGATSRLRIEGSSSLHGFEIVSRGLEGWIELRAGDGIETAGAAARLVVPARSLRSGQALRDRELHRQIQARRHPELSATLRALRAATGASRFVAEGDVTFLGTTRPAAGEVEVERRDDASLHVTGDGTFDVRDFGLRPAKVLGLQVHPDVRVHLEVVAVPAG